MNSFTRHKARKLAVQAVYQWQMTHDDSADILLQFVATANPKKIDMAYFNELLTGVAQHHAELDGCMQPFLDRAITALDVVELAILRIALYELLHRIDVPYKVVINEALELTKIFGSVEGFKYVNGVLDKTVRTLKQRSAELSLHAKNKTSKSNKGASDTSSDAK